MTNARRNPRGLPALALQHPGNTSHALDRGASLGRRTLDAATAVGLALAVGHALLDHCPNLGNAEGHDFVELDPEEHSGSIRHWAISRRSMFLTSNTMWSGRARPCAA